MRERFLVIPKRGGKIVNRATDEPQHRALTSSEQRTKSLQDSIV